MDKLQETTAEPVIFISKESWTSPKRDEAEREKLWPKVWQMACREEVISEVGSYTTLEILDDSILVIRHGAGPDDVHAMYNVCQHRGRKLIERPQGMLQRQITCRFHGWRFGWKGDLQHVTDEGDWANCPSFNKADLTVPALRIARWGGFVWVCMDPEAPSLEEWLAPVTAALGPFALEECRTFWWKRIHAPLNWKVFIEAFNEGYHAGETHLLGINYRKQASPARAVGPHAMFWTEPDGDPAEYKVRDVKNWTRAKTAQEGLWANNALLYDTLFALVLDPSQNAADRVRALPDDTPPEQLYGLFHQYVKEETEKLGASFPDSLNIEAWLAAGTDWHMFPNTIILPALDGALVYRSLPDPKDRDKAYVDVWSLGRFPKDRTPVVEPDFFNNFEEFKGVCPFLEEDFQNMDLVNTGMKNRGWKGAVLNPRQEVQVAHFHRMLEQYCGPA